MCKLLPMHCGLLKLVTFRGYLTFFYSHIHNSNVGPELGSTIVWW